MSRPADAVVPAGEVPAIVVDDTMAALAALGAHARARLGVTVDGRVVGITGSVGKTSVKDLLAGALAARWRTVASEGSFNNELGVPLTLLAAPDGTEAAAVEMGARGPGHIAALCAVARPAVGVVTRVAAVHTETFGSIDAVATAKGELVEALPATGTAVLNAADPRVAAMAARTAASVLTYGEGGASVPRRSALDGELRPAFRLDTPWGVAQVRLAARGRHMVENALAAAAAALACDVLPRRRGRAPWPTAPCPAGGWTSPPSTRGRGCSTTPTTPTPPRWLRPSARWPRSTPSGTSPSSA